MFRKYSATAGGLEAISLVENSSATQGFRFYSFTTADTTKTTSSVGAFQIDTALSVGTGGGSFGADGNILAVGNNGTMRFLFDSDSQLYLIDSATGAQGILGGAYSIASGNASGVLYQAGQLTITGASTTYWQNRFLKNNVTAASALTLDNAATVYIDAAPAAAGSATISNAYALWVDAGNVRIDDVAATSGEVTICATTGGVLVKRSAACTGSDLAEYFPMQEGAEPGDIVSISNAPNPTQDESAPYLGVKSQSSYDGNMLGIVSSIYEHEAPGEGLRKAEHYHLLALAGRVPVKVSTENGAIAIGDYLTSSSTPGVAMKATKAGQVIGMALEAYEGADPGKVTVFIAPHWIGNDLAVSAQGNQLVNIDPEQLRIGLASLGLTVNPNGVLEVDTVKARKVATKFIELVDQQTGVLYCTWIQNGEWVKVQGECDTIQVSNDNNQVTNDTPPEPSQVPPADSAFPPSDTTASLQTSSDTSLFTFSSAVIGESAPIPAVDATTPTSP